MTQSTQTPHVHAECIKAWADGAPIQVRESGAAEWHPLTRTAPRWGSRFEYRIKPREPREFWANLYVTSVESGYLHHTKEEAERARTGDCIGTVRVREVIE